MNIDKTQYKQDAKGNLVPLANIKEIDLLRDELVQEIAAKARADGVQTRGDGRYCGVCTVECRPL